MPTWTAFAAFAAFCVIAIHVDPGTIPIAIRNAHDKSNVPRTSTALVRPRGGTALTVTSGRTVKSDRAKRRIRTFQESPRSAFMALRSFPAQGNRGAAGDPNRRSGG